MGKEGEKRRPVKKRVAFIGISPQKLFFFLSLSLFVCPHTRVKKVTFSSLFLQIFFFACLKEEEKDLFLQMHPKNILSPAPNSSLYLKHHPPSQKNTHCVTELLPLSLSIYLSLRTSTYTHDTPCILPPTDDTKDFFFSNTLSHTSTQKFSL